MSIIVVPKVLRDKLGEDGANALVELLNGSAQHARDDVLLFVEERFERRLSEEAAKIDAKIVETEAKLNARIVETEAKLNTRIVETEAKLNTRIVETEAKLNTRIAQTEAKLEGKIAEVKASISEAKADLIRWMFIFWAGQLGALLGILFAFFRK